MESASILHYLLDIIQTEGLSNMARLASMTILSKLFDSDQGHQIQLKCLEADITSSLLGALDTGLSAKCDPADVVYVSVAMEIMGKLSRLSIGAIQTLITKNVFRRLLAYLDIDGGFYKFPESTRTKIAALCENKQLIGNVRVVSMASEPLDYIHKHTKNKLKRLPRLPDTVKVCHMYDTESQEDLDITQCIIQQHLAYTGSFPGDLISDLQDEWQDIIVTKVLGGGMFWAQVGEQVIKEVYEIQQTLNCDVALGRKISPRTGDHVVVMGDVMGTSCYLRAEILLEDGGSVDVFAVDYGYILTVADTKVYCLPDDVIMSKCSKKISLCTIAGIQPPPFDEGLVHNAAATLANLCKQSITAGSTTCELGSIPIIKRLLQTCQSSKVTIQVVTLLNNLACNSRVTNEICGSNLVETLLGIMSRLPVGNISTHIQNETAITVADADDDRLLLARCTICLTNILFKNSDTREQFYKHQGIDVTIHLLKQVGKKDALYKMAVKLLKIFINQAIVKAAGNTTVPNQPNPYLASSESVNYRTQSPMRGKELLITTTENIGRRHHGQYMRRDVDTSDSECEDVAMPRKDSAVLQTNIPIHLSSSAMFYYLGSTVRIYDDERHEIRPNKKVTSIAALTVAQHVCGMLNSGCGGTLYFGVDKDRTVFGLELSRDEKDRFRLGMDQLMFNKISPVLLHSQFDFKAVPVIYPETDQVIPDLYVIEISVKASKGVIYTMLDGTCFYRFGSETSSITRLELRQLVHLEEESYFMEEIQRLQKQKNDLIKHLQSKNVL